MYLAINGLVTSENNLLFLVLVWIYLYPILGQCQLIHYRILLERNFLTLNYVGSHS